MDEGPWDHQIRKIFRNSEYFRDFSGFVEQWIGLFQRSAFRLQMNVNREEK
jgi:hypothetical protein